MTEAAVFPGGGNQTADSQSASAPVNERVMPVFNDALSSRLNLRLTFIILLLILILFGSLTANFVQVFMGPTTIVMKELPNGGTQVVAYNGRPVESADGSIEVRPDAVQNGDKIYYAGVYAKLLYAPNPSTRTEDVKSALRMMVEDRAGILINCLNRGCEEYDLNLDRQKAQSWQAVWTEQKNEVDSHDPFTVNIIGLQELTYVINNTVKKEKKQISLSIKLVADPLGRAPRNMRNGVQVDSFQYKLLSTSAQ